MPLIHRLGDSPKIMGPSTSCGVYQTEYEKPGKKEEVLLETEPQTTAQETTTTTEKEIVHPPLITRLITYITYILLHTYHCITSLLPIHPLLHSAA